VKKILVVEDEEVFARAAKDLLEAEGFNVYIAMDGMAGLDAARSIAPDLIILDVMLPKLNGFKIARMLKFDEKHKDTPIIMLTSKAADEDKLTAQGCGADAYILKTQNPQILLDTVKKFLSKASL